MVTLLALGLLAGVLTTVAGMGGGLLLIAAIGALRGPHVALAITSPALLVSNAHRAFLFRADIDRKVARSFAIGAVPGAILGGLFVPDLPAWVLAAILVGATSLTLAKVVGIVKLRPNPNAIGTSGFGIGVLTATAGGAGVLTSPLFLSAGLAGTAYIATIALGAVALHVGRVIGYGIGGLFSADMLPEIALLAAALVAGNFLGKRVRGWLPPSKAIYVETGALVACTLLAVVGIR
jgi:uncharacterized membrane protein YfcA